jgi:hypothetical protein
MTKIQIMSSASRAFHKVGFKLKKHSPEILVVAGVVGTVTSAVLACKATLKVNEVIDASKADIEAIHESTEKGCTKYGVEYTLEDSKKDLTIVYVQTGVKLVKLYAPALVIGTASITSILAGHNILRKRNAALASAYAIVDKGFKDYRDRVVERFGKELDHELKYNIKSKEIEETVVNEDGTESTVKKTVEVIDDKPGMYDRFFDETCTAWCKDAEYNLVFVMNAEKTANRKLKQQGQLFLNEVYDLLGMQRSKDGQIVGWVYDPEVPNKIDFNIHDLNDPCKRRFVNGYERSILLNIEPEGNIYDLLK